MTQGFSQEAHDLDLRLKLARVVEMELKNELTALEVKRQSMRDATFVTFEATVGESVHQSCAADNRNTFGQLLQAEPIRPIHTPLNRERINSGSELVRRIDFLQVCLDGLRGHLPIDLADGGAMERLTVEVGRRAIGCVSAPKLREIASICISDIGAQIEDLENKLSQV
jgi:hypothetical protein